MKHTLYLPTHFLNTIVIILNYFLVECCIKKIIIIICITCFKTFDILRDLIQGNTFRKKLTKILMKWVGISFERDDLVRFGELDFGI